MHYLEIHIIPPNLEKVQNSTITSNMEGNHVDSAL